MLERYGHPQFPKRFLDGARDARTDRPDDYGRSVRPGRCGREKEEAGSRGAGPQLSAGTSLSPTANCGALFDLEWESLFPRVSRGGLFVNAYSYEPPNAGDVQTRDSRQPSCRRPPIPQESLSQFGNIAGINSPPERAQEPISPRIVSPVWLKVR